MKEELDSVRKVTSTISTKNNFNQENKIILLTSSIKDVINTTLSKSNRADLISPSLASSTQYSPIKS